MIVGKKELATRAARLIRDQDIKKSVKFKKRKFYIADEDGHTASFEVNSESGQVPYTFDDIYVALDAILETIIDCFARGDEIMIKNIFRMRHKVRAKSRVKLPGTDTWVDVKSRYVPSISWGKYIKNAVENRQALDEREANEYHDLTDEGFAPDGDDIRYRYSKDIEEERKRMFEEDLLSEDDIEDWEDDEE